MWFSGLQQAKLQQWGLQRAVGFVITFPRPLPDAKLLAEALSRACNSPSKSFMRSSSFLSPSPIPRLSKRRISCRSFPSTTDDSNAPYVSDWTPIEFNPRIWASTVSYRCLSALRLESNYLRSLLQGPALDAVAGLTLTDANYNEAVQVLTSRFGNKQLIIDRYMDILLNLEAVVSNFSMLESDRLL